MAFARADFIARPQQHHFNDARQVCTHHCDDGLRAESLADLRIHQPASSSHHPSAETIAAKIADATAAFHQMRNVTDTEERRTATDVYLE